MRTLNIFLFCGLLISNTYAINTMGLQFLTRTYVTRSLRTALLRNSVLRNKHTNSKTQLLSKGDADVALFSGICIGSVLGVAVDEGVRYFRKKKEKKSICPCTTKGEGASDWTSFL